MVYKRCIECGKLFACSTFDRIPFKHYCMKCGYQIFEAVSKELLKERTDKLENSKTPEIVSEDEGSTSSEESMERKRLRNTDNEEEYLDSTRCKYSQSEVNFMKTQLRDCEFKLQDLKSKIRQHYGEINIINTKIQDLRCKLAVAKEEQDLRKKLRRETRELIPSLKSVHDNANNVFKNIHELIGSDNDDCIIISPYFRNKKE